MAEERGVPARQRVEYKEWRGLMTDIDAHNLPPGAAREQVNCVGYDAGQLQSRLGMRELSFESD